MFTNYINATESDKKFYGMTDNDVWDAMDFHNKIIRDRYYADQNGVDLDEYQKEADKRYNALSEGVKNALNYLCDIGYIY